MIFRPSRNRPVIRPFVHSFFYNLPFSYFVLFGLSLILFFYNSAIWDLDSSTIWSFVILGSTFFHPSQNRPVFRSFGLSFFLIRARIRLCDPRPSRNRPVFRPFAHFFFIIRRFRFSSIWDLDSTICFFVILEINL